MDRRLHIAVTILPTAADAEKIAGLLVADPGYLAWAYGEGSA